MKECQAVELAVHLGSVFTLISHFCQNHPIFSTVKYILIKINEVVLNVNFPTEFTLVPFKSVTENI